MQVGFSVYAQAVKHHSLLLGRLQNRIQELEETNTKKDVKINELEEDKLEMAAAFQDLKMTVNAIRGKHFQESHSFHCKAEHILSKSMAS